MPVSLAMGQMGEGNGGATLGPKGIEAPRLVRWAKGIEAPRWARWGNGIEAPRWVRPGATLGPKCSTVRNQRAEPACKKVRV